MEHDRREFDATDDGMQMWKQLKLAVVSVLDLGQGVFG